MSDPFHADHARAETVKARSLAGAREHVFAAILAAAKVGRFEFKHEIDGLPATDVHELVKLLRANGFTVKLTNIKSRSILRIGWHPQPVEEEQ